MEKRSLKMNGLVIFFIALISLNACKKNEDPTDLTGPTGSIIGSGCNKTIATIGQYFISIWEGCDATGWEWGDRTGLVSMDYWGDGELVIFKFDGTGNAIGSTGKDYYGTGFQPRLADVNDTRASVHTILDMAGGGTYTFGIYGWTGDTPDWGNQTERNEFYVDMAGNDIPDEDDYIGQITVEGSNYKMYKFQMETATYQFRAVLQDRQEFNPDINLKPFFDYWQQNGMQSNHFITSLTWGIELLSGQHTGTFQWRSLSIPNY